MLRDRIQKWKDPSTVFLLRRQIVLVNPVSFRFQSRDDMTNRHGPIQCDLYFFIELGCLVRVACKCVCVSVRGMRATCINEKPDNLYVPFRFVPSTQSIELRIVIDTEIHNCNSYSIPMLILLMKHFTTLAGKGKCYKKTFRVSTLSGSL
jgi:hypothetical protein